MDFTGRDQIVRRHACLYYHLNDLCQNGCHGVHRGAYLRLTCRPGRSGSDGRQVRFRDEDAAPS